MTTSTPELVGLLYRANWTQLSLSATVTSNGDAAVDRRLRQRKLSELRQLLGPLPKVGPIPGWDLHDEDDSPQHCERHVLLAPGGRYRQGRRGGLWHLLDRVEVLVDAELGILLRSEQIFEGLTREVAELRDLAIDPPEGTEPGLFAPPPGLPVTDDRWADDCQPSGLGWQVAGTAASLTASAMGFAIRHAPRRQTTWPSGDDEPESTSETGAAAWPGRRHLAAARAAARRRSPAAAPPPAAAPRRERAGRCIPARAGSWARPP